MSYPKTEFAHCAHTWPKARKKQVRGFIGHQRADGVSQISLARYHSQDEFVYANPKGGTGLEVSLIAKLLARKWQLLHSWILITEAIIMNLPRWFQSLMNIAEYSCTGVKTQQDPIIAAALLSSTHWLHDSEEGYGQFNLHQTTDTILNLFPLTLLPFLSLCETKYK